MISGFSAIVLFYFTTINVGKHLQYRYTQWLLSWINTLQIADKHARACEGLAGGCKFRTVVVPHRRLSANCSVVQLAYLHTAVHGLQR